MPADFKITTEVLYKGALVFALMDAIYIPLLVWRVREKTFRSMKWSLIIAAALVWFGIWSWAIGNFWETVYSYVFPAWAQTWVPWIAFVVAGTVALGLWMLTIRLKRNLILTFCLMSGVYRQPDAYLGCVSWHCHQTAHAARRISISGNRHRFF